MGHPPLAAALDWDGMTGMGHPPLERRMGHPPLAAALLLIPCFAAAAHIAYPYPDKIHVGPDWILFAELNLLRRRMGHPPPGGTIKFPSRGSFSPPLTTRP